MLELWNSIFKYIALASILFSLASFIGLWITSHKLEAKKNNRIITLEKTSQAILDYSDVARLDALGNPPGFGPGGDIVFNDELTLLLKGTYEFKNNQIHMSRSPEAEAKYLN